MLSTGGNPAPDYLRTGLAAHGLRQSLPAGSGRLPASPKNCPRGQVEDPVPMTETGVCNVILTTFSFATLFLRSSPFDDFFIAVPRVSQWDQKRMEGSSISAGPRLCLGPRVTSSRIGKRYEFAVGLWHAAIRPWRPFPSFPALRGEPSAFYQNPVKISFSEETICRH